MTAENVGTLAKDFLHFFGEQHLIHRKEKYLCSFKKDVELSKQMITAVGIEDVKIKAVQFFSDNDAFLQKAGFTVGMFFSRFNKYPAQQRNSIQQDYLEKRANELAERILERRRKEFEETHEVSDEELMRRGFVEVARMHDISLRNRYEKMFQSLEERVTKARKLIRAMSDENKKKLVEVLRQKSTDSNYEHYRALAKRLKERTPEYADRIAIKDFTEDKFYREILPYFSPFIFEDVEEMMK